MCKHSNRQKINDTWICLNCGLTILPNGKVIFDREIANYKSKKRKKGGKSGKNRKRAFALV